MAIDTGITVAIIGMAVTGASRYLTIMATAIETVITERVITEVTIIGMMATMAANDIAIATMVMTGMIAMIIATGVITAVGRIEIGMITVAVAGIVAMETDWPNR